MGVNGSELLLIFLAILLLFGAKKIPELARGLGKGVREFKKATEDLKKEITDTEISKDINEIKDNLKG